MLSGEEFGRLFETFERTAFRLETLAMYEVVEEREEIARFLAGEDMGPEWDDNPWVRSMTDKGKNVSRVHVLRSPLADYLRYELSACPGNIKAEESIGIIDLAEQDVTGLPDHDLWLFDDCDVYHMHYTPEGKFMGGELLPADRLAEKVKEEFLGERPSRGHGGYGMAPAAPYGSVEALVIPGLLQNPEYATAVFCLPPPLRTRPRPGRWQRRWSVRPRSTKTVGRSAS
ncbi:DUF6879 family protein [Streptomyces sp. NPDC059862]|uniref:DUF6879 family protein n=1 Tax=Streptomyces sp. NPDC059862 TaxID=3346975 RepID=UPI0036521173